MDDKIWKTQPQRLMGLCADFAQANQVANDGVTARTVEYVIHELAHAKTLDIPYSFWDGKDLSFKISRLFNRVLSEATAVAAEADALVVEYHVMREIGFTGHPHTKVQTLQLGRAQGVRPYMLAERYAARVLQDAAYEIVESLREAL